MVDFLMMFSLCICVLSGVTLLIVHIWSKKKQKKEEAEDKTGGTVFHSGTRNVPKPIKERAGILQVLAPDGANTMPVSYMTLDDNGIELYYAGLYIDKLPVEGRFAHSFAGIFNMDYVESTVIIDPLLEESQKKINRRIRSLDMERSGERDRNRLRILDGKIADAERWARQIDSDQSTLFETYFLFLIRAESLKLLTERISEFISRGKPNGKVVFINSMLYVGAVVYQAYLAVCYISAAVCMVVLVLLFPFAALFEMVERGTISNWMRQVLGILLNPVIDSCLLLIPMFFMIIGTAQESKGYALIALIICGCIIPARGVIRGFLHIGNGMGMELAGFGTIMGATSLMRSIGSGIGAAAGALAHASADAKSDKINADMTDDLADVQKKQDLEDINKGEALQSEMEDIIGENPDLDMDDAETSFAFGYQPTPKEEMHEKSPHAQAAATAQNIASGIDALGRKKDSLNEHIRSNDSKIASIGEEIAMDNEQIASMKAEKQAIQAEQNEQKKRGDTPSADGYARIRELDQGIGEAEHSRSVRMEEQSRLRGENARTKEEIGRIDALSARARSAISPSRSSFGGGVSGIGNGISEEEQEILDQYATIDNFESPQFKNISLERKAALYRERAAKTRVRGATTAAGTMAGMTFGATAGMAMTAFSSPAAKMQMTAIGGAMGANAGGVLGEVLAEPVYEGGVELVRRGGPLLQKGATILKDKAEAYRNNPEGLNVYEEEPQKMLEVNVHSSSKPTVTTVSQSQDNNPSSVETVSGPGSKEQPSYQSDVEAVGKDAGVQSGPQVTYADTVSDEDAAIMQQFYEAEIQKPEFRRTMHHAYTDSAVSARQVYSGLKNSMVNATKEERAVANEQIIETAFMQYTNTILDSLDAPERVDQIAYQQAVEDRLREDERGRMEKYLRSKHLLF